MTEKDYYSNVTHAIAHSMGIRATRVRIVGVEHMHKAEAMGIDDGANIDPTVHSVRLTVDILPPLNNDEPPLSTVWSNLQNNGDASVPLQQALEKYGMTTNSVSLLSGQIGIISSSSTGVSRGSSSTGSAGSKGTTTGSTSSPHRRSPTGVAAQNVESVLSSSAPAISTTTAVAIGCGIGGGVVLIGVGVVLLILRQQKQQKPPTPKSVDNTYHGAKGRRASRVDYQSAPSQLPASNLKQTPEVTPANSRQTSRLHEISIH